MNDDVQHRKEVFASFGGAAYHAQCFEVALQSLLLLAYRLANPDAPLSDLDAADARLSRKNLGHLIPALAKHVQLSPRFIDRLNFYREKRNFLMHRFFFENAMKMLSPRGCDAMINELNELTQLFREADSKAQEITKPLYSLAGWSEAEVSAMVSEELGKGDGYDW